MKRIFTLGMAALLLSFTAHAQRTCGTTEKDAMLQLSDPNYVANKERIEEFTKRYLEKKETTGESRGGSIITIPVVVHVVWNTDDENISDAQAISQIDVLNEDFRRMNADASETPSDFEDVAADFEIEFCLATVDPDGNPTSGIVRVETDVDAFGLDDGVKFTSMGGSDAWPADEYLNMWCCDLGPGLLGYAQFPGGSPSTDGVVITYSSFGREGYVIPPYHLGRTGTHEVGHWLNLRHIWGDDGDCSEPEDFCDDTPAQMNSTYGCPSHPYDDGCGDAIMFQNYMDYTDDECYNMLTLDQKDRARALFEPGGARYDLQFSTKCFSYDYDAQVVDIVSPTGTYCYDTFNPVVTIGNSGLVTLTSIDINYSVDGGASSTYFWTGSLGPGDQENVNLPTLSLSEGVHNLTVSVSNPNGNIDEFADNNTDVSDFVVNVTGFALPLIQGFEDGGFPYAGYTINNPDELWTWEQTSLAAKTGASSIYINTFNISDIGEYDEFQLPAYNMEGLTAAHIDFDLANAAYSYSDDWSDTLSMYVSGDCGITWTRIWQKFKPDLGTASPTGTNFIPTNSQWRTESVSLTPYIADKLIIRFRSSSNWENNTFLDNINMNSGSVDVLDVNAVNFTVYPVPAGNLLNLEYYIAEPNSIVAEIYDALGQLVMSEELKGTVGNNTTTLPVRSLTPGYYTIKLISGGKFATGTFMKD
ncbi:MAG: M43 family zinc metalloprotease [Chitinophagales bacterium]